MRRDVKTQTTGSGDGDIMAVMVQSEEASHSVTQSSSREGVRNELSLRGCRRQEKEKVKNTKCRRCRR